MSDTTYNGWTNYATWRVNLEMFDGMTARDFTGRGVPCVSELKDALKDWVEEIIESTTDEGVARDYAMAFLSDVDWWDIANHMIGEEEEETDEEVEA